MGFEKCSEATGLRINSDELMAMEAQDSNNWYAKLG